MGSIEISVPAYDAAALRCAGDMFHTLADKVGEEHKDIRKDPSILPSPVEVGEDMQTKPLSEKKAPPPPSNKTSKTAPPPPKKVAGSGRRTYTSVLNGVEVDKDGVPWDPRIHSSNHKIRVKDGIWTPMRSVSPVLYKKTMLELKAAMTDGTAKITGEIVDEVTEDFVDDMPADFPSFMSWVIAQDPRYSDMNELNKLVAHESINKDDRLDSVAMLAVNTQLIPVLVELVQNGG